MVLLDAALAWCEAMIEIEMGILANRGVICFSVWRRFCNGSRT